MLNIKPHRWKADGYNKAADFFPFIDGEPRYDINCTHCKHRDMEGADCFKFKETGGDGDDKLYAFCGPICGYFELKEEEVC